MHPQAFLKTFWRGELRPQVFVAMSFAEQYRRRFEEVIAPAISRTMLNGKPLSPYRVDLSKSGDSILTDIVDGIAHSQLVLADVSTLGRDAVTGVPYRNGNVLYEVGVALACRQPSEVLLVRDDEDRFLFDVSSIPHMKVVFTDVNAAVEQVAEGLAARLRERQLVGDARVEIALAGLTNAEVFMLRNSASKAANVVWGFDKPPNLAANAAMARLLDKQLIRLAGEFDGGFPAFRTTPIGLAVIERLKADPRRYKSDPPEPA
jgi:hypothetical protein